MERLPLHIEYLLTRHDCVIVPGLGAFIATETEPGIDHARGVAIPRRREITFNGSVVSDDGLLSHSIARRERLSYEDAHRMLDHLAERMHRELDQEGETSIGRVGKLIKTIDGAIGFRPRQSIINTEIATDVRIRCHQEENYPDAGSMPQPADARRRRIVYEDTDRYVFSISKRLVHAAAVVALLLTICLSVLIPYNKDEEQRASVVPIDDFLSKPLIIDVPDDNSESRTETIKDTVTAKEVIKIL